ncbi:CoA-transferase family III domain-containing protein [Chytriomyces sp. MP71]|nr:CoA-transferase family III domain-containing protein [Chytriomyces sp. MP71]
MFLATRQLRNLASGSAAARPSSPLSGVRVLDLTRVLAGPFCAQILGDYGAEVVKVESLKGDDTRAWGPPFAPETVARNGVAKESSYFLGINRNKRSIAVDFKQKEGLEVIKKLARQSDVVIENFIPGKLESLGLGYEALKEENPGLIYTSITGYGPTGPNSQNAGYDVIIEAEAGLMHITGTRETPVKVGVAITDITTGLYAHGAIMAALLARTHNGGMGQKIDVSLLECQVSALANVAHAYLIGGMEAERLGTEHASIVPYQSFPTKDGHIVIGAGNDGQFLKLCKVIGADHLATNPDYASNQLRVKNRVVLINKLSEILMTKNALEWLTVLKPIGLPVGPVNNISQTFAHPQVLHREMIQEVEHPTAGPIKLVGIPVKYSLNKPTIRRPPPTLGQHTDEILSELKYFPEHISALKRDKVVS